MKYRMLARAGKDASVIRSVLNDAAADPTLRAMMGWGVCGAVELINLYLAETTRQDDPKSLL
jgi:hypothetical protein